VTHRPHGEIISSEILGAFAPHTLNLRQPDRRLKCARNLFGDSILEVEYVVQGAIILICPEMRALGSLDQLDRDAYARPAALDAPFQHVSDAEFTTDVTNIRRSALVGEGRVPGDDEERPNM